ncbi:MAG: DUF2281 domain-containing protein [Gammaproteobacteria bacterium]|nr:DUF2281 domain-containing protein [Gammaproteobacteria bacterium]
MTIADIIYQHVKALPPAKALEVLHFVEFLESQPDSMPEPRANEALAAFLYSLPVGQCSDQEINTKFQALRDEWGQPCRVNALK